MPTRSYDDPCGAARALDVIGERWALLVVRELLLGPRRFAELARGLPAISPNVLSQRLRELERDGILRPTGTGRAGDGRGYELTEHGRQLTPVLLELGRWAGAGPRRWAGRPGDDAPRSAGGCSSGALILALRTAFRPAAAAGLLAWLELRIGVDRVELMIADGELTVDRGGLDDPDATLDADAGTLLELALGDRSLDDATATGAARLTGNRATAARILGCFGPPPPAPQKCL